MENQHDHPLKTDVIRESGWEREIIEKLALAAVTEQTRARRWSIFFKSLIFVYLIAVFGVAMYPTIKQDMGGDSKGHTAVVDVVGVIAEDKDANAAGIIESLRDAVKDKHTKGIILHSNSPGGSPVQSAYVYEEISKIKKEHPDSPSYAVTSNNSSSVCYYIA